jgi:CheY-like chemotaxis protein
MKINRIAVVYDDELIRVLFQIKLTRMGYLVESFSNGCEAVAFYSSNSLPELIITDIMMPLMGGIELAGCIKEINEDAIIIGMTGGDYDPELNLNSVFFLLLEKNEPIDQLLKKIFQHLDKANLM